MTTTTEALVIQEVKGKFSIGEISVGPIQPDEVLVEIHATGICHTDLSCADGTIPISFPAILGHEGAGIVQQVGDNCTGLAKGDKVLLSFSSCGQCVQCADGHPSYCLAFVPLNFGGARPDGSAALNTVDGSKPFYSSFFGQSSFARTTVVNRSSVVKVSEDTDLQLLAPLGCGFQTGAGAVLRTLDVQANSTVAIFGVGSVGMSAIMAAKIRGAKEIIAVDLQQGRLDLALKVGATQAVRGDDPDLVKKIQQLAPPDGVNYAVDCSGVASVVDKMMDCLGTRGRAASVGAPAPGVKASIDIFNHLISGKAYVGCCEGDSLPSEFIPYLIEQQRDGNYPIEKLVKVYDVKEFQQAIDDTKAGVTLKAVINWSE